MKRKIKIRKSSLLEFAFSQLRNWKIVIWNTWNSWWNIILAWPRVIFIYFFGPILFRKCKFPVLNFMKVICAGSRSLRKLHFRSHTSSNFSTTRSFFDSLSLWIISARTRRDLNIFFVFYSRYCDTTFSVGF